MAQVFVSYKSEDRARLRLLVEALEAEGIEVWWDARIEGGSSWRESIEQQLESARCVLVAWSERSVGPEGRFVRDEAGRALSRGAYLPILLDTVRLPIGFGEVQALSLVGWKGNPADTNFRAVLTAVRSRVEGLPAATPPTNQNELKHTIARRSILAGGATAIVAAGAGGWLLWRRPAGSDDKSIAVLPFANLSDDPGQSYFADGLAEELRGALTRIAQIKVIARTSCDAVRNSPVTEAARRLGVANILIGSVRRSPSLIRVSAQLVDGGSGVEVWSETYDRAPGDVLQIQAGIAEKVADALRVRLAPAEKAALKSGDAINIAAHDLYLKAGAVLRGAQASEAGSRQALALIDAAIAADPDYVAALAMRSKIAFEVANDYESGDAFRRGLRDSLVTAQRAVALDAKSAVAQSALAWALGVNFDFVGCLERSQLAYRLAPGDPEVVRQYCETLRCFGRVLEGLAIIERAVARDPLDPRTYVLRARLLIAAKRYPDAPGSLQRALELRPKYDGAHRLTGDMLVLTSRPSEALQEYEQMSEGWNRFTGLAIARAGMGDRAGSDRELAELKKIDDGTLNVQFAEVYAQRGEPDQAAAALGAAYSALDGGLNDLLTNPLLEPVRGDSRVQALIKRLHFPT